LNHKKFLLNDDKLIEDVCILILESARYIYIYNLFLTGFTHEEIFILIIALIKLIFCLFLLGVFLYKQGVKTPILTGNMKVHVFNYNHHTTRQINIQCRK